MGKSVFITGAQGFIGSHLTAYFQSQGLRVIAPDFDICSYSQVNKAIYSSGHFDVIIHLAGISSVSQSEADIERTIQVNVGGTQNLLEALFKNNFKGHFIFASTGQVYQGIPQEEAYTEESSPSPMNFYSRSKFAAEGSCRQYSEFAGFKVTVLRLFNHTHKDQPPDFFLPSVFLKLQKIKNGQTSELVVGNTELFRDLSSIQSLQEKMLILANSEPTEDYALYNIGSGKRKKLRLIIDQLAAQLNVSFKLVADPKLVRSGESLSVVGSSEKFEKKFNFRSTYSQTEQNLVHEFLQESLSGDPQVNGPQGRKESIMTSVMKVPVAKPALVGNEKKYVMECIDTEWISSNGKYIPLFEEAFSKYIGTKQALTCSNGTVALHIPLLAMDIGPEDEVIVPALTYIATANAVKYVNAKVVFVDVDPETLTICPKDLAKKITAKTKAVIVVHLYGHSTDMDPIMELSRKHHFYVIEDCAESLGGTYKNTITGGIGHVGTFSFFGNKTITTGEGGMVTTNDELLANKMRILKGQGMDPNRRYWHTVVGYNYRMTNIQAAIGLAQLEKIEWHLEQRRRVAATYNELLKSLKDQIELPVEKDWACHSYWMYTILLKSGTEKKRDALMAALAERGVETRPVFYPMHFMPPHKTNEKFTHSEDAAARGINLPTFAQLTEEQLRHVADSVRWALTLSN